MDYEAYTAIKAKAAAYLSHDPERNRVLTKALDEFTPDALNACRSHIQSFVSKAKGLPENLKSEETIDKLFNDIVAWGSITPTILNGASQGISELAVYGPRDVWIQKDLEWIKQDHLAFPSEDELYNVVDKITAACRINLSEMQGFTDKATLPNGSRVSIVQAPYTDPTFYMTIRLFNEKLFTSNQLIASGSVTELQDRMIKFLMKGEIDSLFTGPMSSGKTTHLAAYAAELPDYWHVLTIEDIAEIHLKKRNPDRRVSAFYVHEEHGLFTWDQAHEQSLRSAAQAIIYGELRSAKMLKKAITSANTGHHFSSSLHAISPEQAIDNSINKYIEATPGMDIGIASSIVCKSLNVIFNLKINHMTKRRYMSDIAAVTWDRKHKEPVIESIIKRRITKRGELIETFNGIPQFLKQILLDRNTVFEEDFNEWT